MADQRDIAELVADRPDLEDDLAAVLAVDEGAETWTFEDVPVETGPFGEIVGQGIVESVDDGYRVADPDAVRAVLADDEADAGDGGGGSGSVTAPSLERPALSVGVGARRVGVGLVVAALFVAARSVAAGKVLRDGNVVLAGNDPYFYRYVVDQLLARSRNPLALGTVVEPGAGSGTLGEPLLVATLWWVSALLGGTREVAGLVLAWYPVVAALAVGALVYAVGARVLGDRRVGVLAAAILAVVPAHAMRTSLGFADHHAFDYAWLMAVVAALVWLATLEDPFGRAARRGAATLAVAVAGLTLAWEGSPLMLLPVGLYLGLVALLDVVEERSPVRSNAPVLAGLGGAAVVTLVAHFALSWGTLFVAVTPALLAVGGVVVAGGSELLADRGVGVRGIAAAEFAVPLVGVALLSVVAGGALAELASGFAFVYSPSEIAETGSAFGFGQLVGVELFGGVVFLALPVLVWSGRRALLGDRRWLALGVFTWYFLGLSVLQLRFMGQLAPLASLFAAVGLVWAFARYDLTTPPVPVRESATTAPAVAPRDDPDDWLDASRVGLRSGVVALVIVAAVVGPGVYFLSDKVSGSAVSDRNYRTAQFMADYADERGWTYPDNYVLSRWGISRALNYPVNGQTAGYGFAQANYPAFVTDPDPDPKYDTLRDRVGFVVLEPLPPRDNTTQQHLYNTYGSRWVQEDGTVRYEAVRHYRAVYTTPDGANRVFVLVEGAPVTGRATPNATVELETTVSIPNDRFTYRTVVTANASGQYRVRVPYPGEYTVSANNRTRTVTVPESAVRNGTRVAAGN